MGGCGHATKGSAWGSAAVAAVAVHTIAMIGDDYGDDDNNEN